MPVNSLKRIFAVHSPKHKFKPTFYAAICAFFTISLLGYLTKLTGYEMLIAPFGASCVLAFGLPKAPVSQPLNILISYIVATAISFLLFALFGFTIWVAALGVAASLFALLMLRVTHPPAGGIPLVVSVAHPALGFFIFPILTGVVTIISLSLIANKVIKHD